MPLPPLVLASSDARQTQLISFQACEIASRCWCRRLANRPHRQLFAFASEPVRQEPCAAPMRKLTGVLNTLRGNAGLQTDRGERDGRGKRGWKKPRSAETRRPSCAIRPWVAEGIGHAATRAAQRARWGSPGLTRGSGHPQGLPAVLERGGSLAPAAPRAGERSRALQPPRNKRASCAPEAARFKKPIFLMSYSQ